MTKNKQLIIDILTESGGHLTAEEVFLEAKKRSEKISLATVYNNLNALCEESAIRRMSSSDGKDRYDKAYMPHGHLVCEKCRKIIDFPSEGIADVVLRNTGVRAESYDLNVYYVCDDCKNNRTK